MSDVLGKLIRGESRDMAKVDWIAQASARFSGGGSKAPSSMTSQEIADLVESRHDSVKRAIERLANQGVITFPPAVEKSSTGGRPSTEFVFEGEQGKRDSIIVVAQLSPVFTARLVDRWQELEGSKRPMTGLEFARLQVQLYEEIERKERESETLRITLDESKQWSSVKRMEAKLCRRFDWKPLKDWSDENEIDIQKVFDQNYGTVNAYRADAWRAVYGIEIDG